MKRQAYAANPPAHASIRGLDPMAAWEFQDRSLVVALNVLTNLINNVAQNDIDVPVALARAA